MISTLRSFWSCLCNCLYLVTPFVKVDNLHFIHMIFLVSVQRLFMSLLLFFVKVLVLFHLLFASLNLFPFLQYNYTCFGGRNTLQPFLVFLMSLQNKLYAVFFEGSSGLGVFKGFTLKTLHTLSAF